MPYPDVRYETTKWDDYLELCHFNGTRRGVMFRNADSARRALLPGRAELDCVAIDDGLMPSGAYLVSRAGMPDDLDALISTNETTTSSQQLLDIVRLRFSLSLAISRGDYITEARDAAVRLTRPERAARYDRAIAIMNGDA